MRWRFQPFWTLDSTLNTWFQISLHLWTSAGTSSGEQRSSQGHHPCIGTGSAESMLGPLGEGRGRNKQQDETQDLRFPPEVASFLLPQEDLASGLGWG